MKTDLAFLRKWLDGTYVTLHHMNGEPCILRIDQVTSATRNSAGATEVARPDGKWVTVKESPVEVMMATREGIVKQLDWAVDQILRGLTKAVQNRKLGELIRSVGDLLRV